MVNGLKQEAESVTDGGTTTAGHTLWRGFLTRNVVVPGFVYGREPLYDEAGNKLYNDDGTPQLAAENSWFYSYGELGSIDVLNQNNATATIMNGEPDGTADSKLAPDASYDIAVALAEINAQVKDGATTGV